MPARRLPIATGGEQARHHRALMKVKPTASLIDHIHRVILLQPNTDGRGDAHDDKSVVCVLLAKESDNRWCLGASRVQVLIGLVAPVSADLRDSARLHPACCCSVWLSPPGKLGDPRTVLQFLPGCTRDTTTRLTAHTQHASFPALRFPMTHARFQPVTTCSLSGTLHAEPLCPTAWTTLDSVSPGLERRVCSCTMLTESFVAAAHPPSGSAPTMQQGWQ
jgi:hypothetical protein